MISSTPSSFQIGALRLAGAVEPALSQWVPDSPKLSCGFLVSRKDWGRSRHMWAVCFSEALGLADPLLSESGL